MFVMLETLTLCEVTQILQGMGRIFLGNMAQFWDITAKKRNIEKNLYFDQLKIGKIIQISGTT